ncbi:MAG: hypothetical protein ABL889_15755 [Terricaulis sp.]
MQVGFIQGYTDADRAEYLFSSPRWQGFMEDSISGLGLESASFAERYAGYDIVFFVDARAGLSDAQLRGIDVYAKGKRLEIGLVLPHPGGRVMPGEAHRPALENLFSGVELALQSLGFDTAQLNVFAPTWINQIVSDDEMFRSPDKWGSWRD